MIIGTDVSLYECRKEGYLMMDFKQKELITKGVLNPDVTVRFFSHYPDYVLKDMYGTEKPVGVPTILTDVRLTANNVWEMYVNNKEAVDSLCGIDSREFPKNAGDLVSLASDVDGFCGIDN